MAGRRVDIQICPADPDCEVQEILALKTGRMLSMQSGEQCRSDGAAYTLVGAVRGEAAVTSNAQFTLLEGGQAAVLYDGGPYTLQGISDCQCVVISLQGELAGRLLPESSGSQSIRIPRGAAALRAAAASLAVLDRESPPVRGETASALAYELLMKLRVLPIEEPSPLPELVEAAVSIIQEEFPFLEGLDDLAERLEVSKAHLIRTFTRKTGVSPGKYITRTKVEYAKLLLQDADVSIAYAAEASGFSSANYFAKVFRRETGMTPSEYLESIPRRNGPARMPASGPGLW